MSLPTAHQFLFENLMENLISIENHFLEPKVLMQLLKKTENVLNEGIEILSEQEFPKDTLKQESLKTLVEKLSTLERASREKVNWVNHFSQYLQENTYTK